jgi:hypothetical protein
MPFDAVSFARATNPVPGVFNYSGGSLPRWKDNRSKVRIGQASPKMAFVGDSTFAGLGAGADGSKYTGARQRSTPAFVAQALMARDSRLKTPYANIWGDSGDASLVTGNPELTLGAGWAYASAGAGGSKFANSTTTNAMTWIIPVTSDTIVISWSRNTGLGTHSYSVDGAAPASVSQDGASGFQSTTISVAPGMHTLEIRHVSGQIYIDAVEAFNSTVPSLRVNNMGRSGAQSSYWTTTSFGFSSLPSFKAFAPDVTVLSLGINNMKFVPAAVTNGPFAADMRTIITAAKLTGDVLLVLPNPVSLPDASQPLQDTLRDIYRALALEFDCPMVDVPQVMGTHATANARGLFFDNLHPNAPAYDLIAGLIADVLLRP